MKKLIFVFLIFIITGCGTERESINYNGGGEEMNMNMNVSIRVLEMGDKMRFEISLTNESDETKVLQFPSGQLFELIVKDEHDFPVYRYSEGRMFTMAIVHKEVKPKETITFVDEWEEWQPGKYTVIAQLLISAINGEPVDQSQFSTMKEVYLQK